MSKSQSTLTFKRFGWRYVVVGPVAEIAAAVKRGHADVSLKDGTMKRVTVDREQGDHGRYITKDGRDTWTFSNADTGAFVPVDDRPAKSTESAPQPATEQPATEPASAIPGLPVGVSPEILAQALALIMAADPQPEQPTATPAPQPVTATTPAATTGDQCSCCSQPATTVHAVAQSPSGDPLPVCRDHASKSSTAVKRAATKRAGELAQVGA